MYKCDVPHGIYQDTNSYSQLLYKLVKLLYLKPSTVLSHESPRDKIIKYESEEKAKIPGFPTSRQLREAKETAEAKLKREEEAAESVGIVSLFCSLKGGIV